MVIHRKKVLHVTPFFPPDKGGIAYLVENLCLELSKYENEITIISATKNNNEKTQMANGTINIIKIHSVYFPGWPYSTLRSFSFPLDLGLKFMQLIKNENYDIIHVHGHHYPISWFAIYYGSRKKIPILLSIHGMYALNPKSLGGKSALEEIFNKIILRWLLSRCDIVIGGTSRIIDYVKKYSNPRTTFSKIPNGVNTEKFTSNIHNKKKYRIKYNLKEGSVVVLFIGRFEEVKGILEFTKAVQMLVEKHPNFEVVIVGDGKLHSDVSSIVKSREIQILSWAPPETIHEIYLASDIFVLSSKFEALPLTILEAMNAKLHIIYSHVGGVNDILEGYNKKTMLAEVSTKEIYDKILTVSRLQNLKKIDIDSNLYATSFSWRNIAKEVNQLYEKIHKT